MELNRIANEDSAVAPASGTQHPALQFPTDEQQHELPPSIKQERQLAAERQLELEKRREFGRRLAPLRDYWHTIYENRPNLNDDFPSGWLLYQSGEIPPVCELSTEELQQGMADGTLERQWKRGFAERLFQFGRLAKERGVTELIDSNVAATQAELPALAHPESQGIVLDDRKRSDVSVALDLLRASLHAGADQLLYLIEQCPSHVSWWWPFGGTGLQNEILIDRVQLKRIARSTADSSLEGTPPERSIEPAISPAVASAPSKPVPLDATNNENAVQAPRRKQQKRGRKKIDVEEERSRLELLERWEKAKAADSSQKEFCCDHNVSLQKLRRCIEWCRTRNNRDQQIDGH